MKHKLAPNNKETFYQLLSPETVNEAKEAAVRIRSHLVKNFISIGQELQKVKALLEHGQFGKWLKAEFNMSERSAQRYMSAAVCGTRLAGKKLPRASILALAAPTTPAMVRRQIIASVEAGNTPPEAKEIRALITEAKNRKGRVRQAAQSAGGPKTETWSGNKRKKAIIHFGEDTKRILKNREAPANRKFVWVQLKWAQLKKEGDDGWLVVGISPGAAKLKKSSRAPSRSSTR
jgi:hypothetical protein